MNVPSAGHVAVVDRDSGTVIEKFPLKEARANFPMALDEANHRLFIGGTKRDELGQGIDLKVNKQKTTGRSGM